MFCQHAANDEIGSSLIFVGLSFNNAVHVISIVRVPLTPRLLLVMTSSEESFFRVTGPLCGEFTDHWRIPLTKGQQRGL